MTENEIFWLTLPYLDHDLMNPDWLCNPAFIFKYHNGLFEDYIDYYDFSIT